ncbi:MAG: type ISP restriction/modification enzyme [Pseudomonadota bacterium]
MDIAAYIAEITRLADTGQTTEHSFRPALAQLLDSVAADVNCINEPEQIRNVGRPDFVLLRDNGDRAKITVGHVEAKDIGLDIRPRAMRDANKDQWERYTKALPNLIYTNGLDFAFYKNSELVRELSIGEQLMGVQAKPENFDALANQLKDFAAERLQTITSAETLAEMMAGKAVLIKDVLFNTLREDEELTSELAGQYKAFQSQLIHDLDIGEFADIYAETIAYGMFAARLHDETLQTFTRVEALTLLPKSNPFLRKLFEFVAGPSLPDGIAKTLEELAEVFQATDLQKLFKDFGSFTQRNDPFIHFYETFLAKYNPAKRKVRGVWYTPEPVVNFIVRAVDDVLKSEFGLSQGLADTSKVPVTYEVPDPAKPGKWKKKTEELHRVQILDPAAGTGTFLAEVIRQISQRISGIAPGALSSYIENDLVPRLHGFELLMASYAMCHMKLDMMLTAMGYKPTGANPPRLGVYLTNSLEEGEREVPDLFMARWLSEEARLANDVKTDKPIMCIIGNPPYSGESANKGDWIVGLMEAYKKEPGGVEKLKERNPKWINDDYVKFIRFSEHMIAKNGEGVLGFITNHGYLDNPTFRGMRWHLLNTFDKIWVLDLHGNAKKKEVSPDGSPDKNVFDIQQGVALIIAVKKKRKAKGDKPPATVMHGDLWGSRKEKYEALVGGDAGGLSVEKLEPHKHWQMFYPIDNALLDTYDAGFKVTDLMTQNVIGFQSHRDNYAVAFDKQTVSARLAELLDREVSDQFLKQKYSLSDNRDWQLSFQRNRIADWPMVWDRISACSYRPFDERHCLLDEAMMDYPRWPLMRSCQSGANFALNVCRQTKHPVWGHAVVSRFPAPAVYVEIKDGSNFAPLHYVDDIDQSIRVNMDPKIRRVIEAAAMDVVAPHPEPAEGRGETGAERAEVNTLALRQAQDEGVFAAAQDEGVSAATPDHGVSNPPDITPRYGDDGRPNEVAIFDYIYGVLHCPAYRETYKEFLKIDFPRIPYPPSPEVFRDVQEKGTALRRLHLMEEAVIGETPFPFTGDGDSVVGKLKYEGGAVFINDTQCFEAIPEIAWNFYIGGYQPAQKWLKDRKGRTLSFDDILHYQKIIKILSETDRMMKTIQMPLAGDAGT